MQGMFKRANLANTDIVNGRYRWPKITNSLCCLKPRMQRGQWEIDHEPACTDNGVVYCWRILLFVDNCIKGKLSLQMNL